MTDHGDDCYFFYYSTCSKGDSCPFRHCEAAMGNETVCSLWQDGRCYRKVCMFRHMEIKKNRKVIACYWETQPAGCQKPHCAFHHEKPRYIDGMYVAPDIVQGKMEEPIHEEPAPPPPAPLPTSANPQLRGVIKAETQENVPSPTHPPVVINPADDDEDEDDQFSEEGEDGTKLTSPRKQTGGSSSGECLNFGVSTLEEIRLRKALKASMKRTGYPVISPHTTALRTNGEKENFRLFSRPALHHVADDPVIFEEPGKPRGCIAERLGKKMFNNDAHTGRELPLKRSLAERLGRFVDEEDMMLAPQKVMKPMRERLGMSTDPIAPTEPAVKPMRERLGLTAEPVASTEPAVKPMRERLGLTTEPVASAEPAIPILEANIESRKGSSEQIRIKAREIRRQKEAKSQSEKRKDSPAAMTPTITKSTKGTKRTITVQPASVKTFSEILHAKKKQWQEEEQQKLERKASSPKKAQEEAQKKAMQAQEEPPKKAKQAQEEAQSKSLEMDVPSPVGSPAAGVRVKTLEEIRREKAARMQAHQKQEPENKKGSDSDEAPAKKPRLLRITKPASPVSNTNDSAVSMTIRRTAEMTEKPVKVAAAETNPDSSNNKVKPVKVAAVETNPASSNDVKVKTFDEIMREKRLRKQQMEEPASSTSQSDSSSEAEPCQKQTTGLALKRNISIKARMASTISPSSPASDAPIQDTKPPIHQVAAPKSKPASPICSIETATTAETSASLKQSSPPRQAEENSPSHSVTNGSKVSPGKRKRSSPPAMLSKQVRGQDSQGPPAEESPVEAQKKCFGQATESKVRPKLNVKPSVMKPAAQVKPGQKRKAAGRSAVAAVKPLNSASTAMEEPAQELPYKRREMSPLSLSAETQQSHAGPMSSTSLLSSGPDTSPVREDLQAVPVIQQKSPVQVLPTNTAGNSTGAARETCNLPQSPIMKSPTQSKSRRPSLAASRVLSPTSTSAVDDFEELMNEFTDDHLEDDMDHGMGEDDLLQELTEMIDS